MHRPYKAIPINKDLHLPMDTHTTTMATTLAHHIWVLPQDRPSHHHPCPRPLHLRAHTFWLVTTEPQDMDTHSSNPTHMARRPIRDSSNYRHAAAMGLALRLLHQGMASIRLISLAPVAALADTEPMGTIRVL